MVTDKIKTNCNFKSQYQYQKILIVSTTNFGVPIDTIAKNFKRQCLIKIIDEKIKYQGQRQVIRYGRLI
jgi:hypothetical protein